MFVQLQFYFEGSDSTALILDCENQVMKYQYVINRKTAKMSSDFVKVYISDKDTGLFYLLLIFKEFCKAL